MTRLGLLAFFLTIQVGQAQDSLPAEPKQHRNLVFGKGGDTDLKLNLVVPAGEGPFPAVVLIHGGGWRGGSYQDAAMNALMQRLARRGYAAASIQYRLTTTGARFPTQIEDCKCAVRWLRGNAKTYQIDPSRIAALGASAGGHLALLLGLTTKEDGLEGTGDLKPEFAQQPSNVQAVVNIFGPTDLVQGDWSREVEPLIEELLGGKVADKTDLAKKASPLTYIEAGRTPPPILSFHGTKDNIVPFIHATKLQEALGRMKANATLVTVEGEGHGWGGDKLEKSLKQVMAFLDEHLKGKK